MSALKINICQNCGASSFVYKDGYKVCEFCGTRYELEGDEIKKSSKISLKSDIDILLEKCKNEPTKAKMYANRILDIDPTNKEALKYL